MMDSKSYRLREFIRPGDGRSLVIDASAGLSLGALPGLEHFAEAVQPVLPLVDGLIASPGQARRLSGRTRADAALLVRADWTNALRGPDFVLPPETISHLPLLTPEDALDLGASAIVLYFLLGHEEHIEAGCLRNTVQFALQGAQVGLPLLVDVQPVGPRVVLRGKAIELGVSYAVEGGADGVAVLWPGSASFGMILKLAAGLPVWIKPTSLDEAESELAEGLSLGAAGLWLDERTFAQPEPAVLLEKFRTQVHQPVPAG
jgi:DhnA family fructose-bisphosphate aldolase class Ia